MFMFEADLSSNFMLMLLKLFGKNIDCILSKKQFIIIISNMSVAAFP